ncbi:MAG: AAA family ATPase [Bdellovibrionales bacterium]|nr:AAA family ATPase [Bdellovibrionales bacterium]
MAKQESKLQVWTRGGWVQFPWTDHEVPERLVLSAGLRAELDRLASMFSAGRDQARALRIPWTSSACFYGPSGTGKSAGSRYIARKLGWPHLTIPAHQILDAHFFQRAMADAAEESGRVIALENIDQMYERMEPEEFFSIFDFAIERAEGFVWIGTTRHAARLPKSQFVRPGRLERMVRFDQPDAPLRRALWIELLVPHFSSIDPGQEGQAQGSELDEATLTELVARSEGLVHAHFEELRRISARLRTEGRQMELLGEAESFMNDQILTPDRTGGISDSTRLLTERLEQSDARTLMAAMDMADVLKRIMKKVVADAFEDAQTRYSSGDAATPP